MSLSLTTGDAARPKLANANAITVGRRVAAAELRVHINIADVQAVLDALLEHREAIYLTNGNIDLAAYRARIHEVDTANTDLQVSVERLTELIDVGADLLLITIGRSICDTLARLAESAHAHATALADGA